MDRPCTLTMWQVRPGLEQAFLETLSQLAQVLQDLPHPPAELTLLQSATDPAAYCSVGWFHTTEEMEAMRQDAGARQLLERLVTLCSEFHPTAHRVVDHYSDSTTSAERMPPGAAAPGMIGAGLGQGSVSSRRPS